MKYLINYKDLITPVLQYYQYYPNGNLKAGCLETLSSKH